MIPRAEPDVCEARENTSKLVTARPPTRLEPDLIFLQPRPHVSLMQATGLLGWSRRQMSDAIENGEVDLWATPLREWFPQVEMIAQAL
jgi:hypothetical protein